MLYNFKKPDIYFDFSKSDFEKNFISSNQDKIEEALQALEKIESGEIMNPTEDRMVGHYWLRDTNRSPFASIKTQIDDTLSEINSFVDDCNKNSKFESILLIGIGGSALGPQFISRALKFKATRKIYFFDNTDPEGYEDVVNSIPDLNKTLVIVITKSGTTPETVNGMQVAKHVFSENGLSFSEHAVAITVSESKLDRIAQKEKWLASFPLWDWVGGRTSIWSSVGILPCQMLGFDTDEFLRGGRDIDHCGRQSDPEQNPAMLLALYWLQQTKGKSEKNMVVLPYSDRLELFGKYLQQLIMESLGKEKDLDGNIVNQGITVFGNKGSTDQHSYIQQLRAGLNDFFAIFVKPIESNSKYDIEVNDNKVSEYLNGFFLGTRQALFDNGRSSLSIIIPKIDEYNLGALIATFERAVSYYASFVNINAYDQPGVEAGKKAATEFLKLQNTTKSLIELIER